MPGRAGVCSSTRMICTRQSMTRIQTHLIIYIIAIPIVALALSACGTASPDQPAPESTEETDSMSSPAPSLSATPPQTPAADMPTTLEGFPTLISKNEQGDRPIAFSEEETSQTIEGSVTVGNRNDYTFAATQGQFLYMMIESDNDNGVFAIFAPSTGYLTGTEHALGITQGITAWSGYLPDSGDYNISVGATNGIANYRIVLTLVDEPPGSLSPDGRILFRPGETAAVVQGSLTGITADLYVFSTAPGQTIHIALNSSAGQATLTVIPPTLVGTPAQSDDAPTQTADSQMAQRGEHVSLLANAGDYTIMVYNHGGGYRTVEDDETLAYTLYIDAGQ